MTPAMCSSVNSGKSHKEQWCICGVTSEEKKMFSKWAISHCSTFQLESTITKHFTFILTGSVIPLQLFYDPSSQPVSSSYSFLDKWH